MSTEISASAVMQLREKTGAGMMDCKKALAEAGGDTEKRLKFCVKRVEKSAEKADRVAKEGIVLASVNDAKNAGVMIEMNCETDFVARNADFMAFANKVLEEVRQTKPVTVDAFLNASASFSNGKTVGDSIAELTGKIGEKIAFKRFTTINANSGVIADYIHPGNKLGVLVQLEIENYDASVQADAYTLARDIAMQTAAMSPLYVHRTEVPQDLLEKEMAILREQGKNEGKPEKVLENIIKGRLEKYLQEICLVEQIFVKDSSKTIKELVNDFGKKIGKKVAVQKFERFRLGD